MSIHEKYIKRCFDIAKIAQNNVKSNPNVGSVIVHNGNIIAEGYHEMYGSHHAEKNAIYNVKEEDKKLLSESILYVSLEPCCIHGKTPPCSDLIINSGIKKIVVSAHDPNPEMQGKSIAILRDKGIVVIDGILEQKGLDLIKPFRANLSKRPYVILKFAQSSDAYFGKRGRQVWISGKKAQVKVHLWRSQIDAILIGYQTALIDNPQLTTRLVDGTSPFRVVIDDQLSLPKTHSLWSDDKSTLFICQDESLVKKDVTKSVIYIAKDEQFYANILEYLYKIGKFRLMVEGGAQTIKNFIAADHWDEARIIRSRKALNSGIRAPFVKGRLVRKDSFSTDTIEYVFND